MKKMILGVAFGAALLCAGSSISSAFAKAGTDPGPGGCKVSSSGDLNTGYCLKGGAGNSEECRKTGEGNRCSSSTSGSAPWLY